MKNINNIALPSEKTVVFMMGAAGSGKSTVIANSNLNALPVVDCDQFKAAHPDYDPTRPQLLHEWSQVEAKKYMLGLMTGEQSFIVDGTGRNAARMIKDIQDVQAVGFTAIVVYVEVTLATSLKRNAARTRNVPETVVREQHELIPISYQLVSRYADQMTTIYND